MAVKSTHFWNRFKAIILVFLLAATASAYHQKIIKAVDNVITNGDFETGDATGWSVSGGTASVGSSLVHAGTYAFNSTGGQARQMVTVTSGEAYTLTAWVYITDVSGGSWGGPRILVADGYSYTDLASSGYIHESISEGNWYKTSLTFTSTSDLVALDLDGMFGDRTVDITFDDVMVYTQPETNTLPTLTTVTPTSDSVSSIGTTVSFTHDADDPDGSISYYFWDFGDGGKSNELYPSHVYTHNGVYQVRLTVYDSDDASATATTTVTVNDSSLPTIAISTPASDPHTSSSASVSVSGSAAPGSGQTITSVTWSTDRGLTGTATGTTTWSFDVDLTNYGGRNRLLVNALDSAGNSVSQDIVINYSPSSPVSVVNNAAGVIPASTMVEQYEKFEATFSLQNSVAANPYIPYETDLPAGMNEHDGQGITVSGIFTSPSDQVYVQPGFYYQPYVRDTDAETLIAQGDAVWKVRFAPQELGPWTYQIGITDASGSVTVSGASLSFTVIAPTNDQNHGFVQVSQTDTRYFEFSDGTPFIGVGPAPLIEGYSSFSMDDNMALVSPGGANFARTWMSRSNIAGSSWCAWQGGLGYEGNVPYSSLTTEQAYGDEVYSLTLPQPDGSNSKCAFFGFNNLQVAIKPNTDYRILLRVKSVGVTGSGGLTFRPDAGWADTCDDYAGQPLDIPYVTGTKDWHVVTATWNSGANTHLGYSLLTLENVTSGRVYLDEVSLREDLGDGTYGPEVLLRSKVNVHTHFGQEASYNWDYGLDQYAQEGIYNKIVISEKQDYAFNYLAPSGYGTSYGGEMQTATGANLKYQQYYWRYLIARYGYSRAVHSFEYANEQAPQSLYMAQQLATYLDSYDPARHLANSSNWARLDGGWTQPEFSAVDYADFHAYVTTDSDDTSWLKDETYPLTLSGTVISSYASLASDSSLYTFAHSMDAWLQNAGGDKPLVLGEAGFGSGGITAGNEDTDVDGVWLHQFLWPQMNPGSMYALYWYEQTIESNNLYHLFPIYRQFMEGKSTDLVDTRIPLNNGHYQDIGLTLPAGIHGWGQKDTTNGGAHFWLYDSAYTWTTPSLGSSLANTTVSFSGLPADAYTVEFWDTWDATVTTQTVNHSGDTMAVTVPSGFTQKDVAVKIYPDTGFVSPGDPAPAIAYIVPSSETNDQSAVPFTITGNNFQQGATVVLSSIGSTVVGTGLTVTTTEITGNFDLNGATAATYDLIVTNPDTQIVTLDSGFIVNQGVVPTDTPTPTPTDTPTPTPIPAPLLTDIAPTSEYNNQSTVPFTITGNYFQEGAAVILSSIGSTVVGTGLTISTTEITGNFDLNGVDAAIYDLVITNSDDQSDTLENAFTVLEYVAPTDTPTPTPTDTPVPTPIPAPILTDITPTSEYNNQSTVPFTITGNYFQEGATVVLSSVGCTDIPGTDLTITTTEILGNFDLNGAQPAVYNLAVINPDSQIVVLESAFIVNEYIAPTPTETPTSTDTPVPTPIPAPILTDITPSSEFNNQSTVPFTITGNYFQEGAIVVLSSVGSTVVGTGLTVTTTEITGNFDLNGVTADTYNVIVTNPDTQIATLESAFVVNEYVAPTDTPTPTATDTPTPTPTDTPVPTPIPAPTLTSITPSSEYNDQSAVPFTITGNYFRQEAIVVLVSVGSTVVGTGLTITTTEITGNFDLNGVEAATFDLIVTNTDDQFATLESAFIVNQYTPPLPTSTIAPSATATPTTPPLAISNLSVATTTTSATVTWDTNRAASSLLNYGVYSIGETSTGQLNADNPVTSHEITLSDLVSCSSFTLQAVAQEGIGSTAIASTTFTTQGCVADSPIIVGAQQTAPANTSTSLTLNRDTYSLTLSAGSSVSDQSLTYQIQQLDKDQVFALLSPPSSRILVGSHVYELKALSSVSQEVTTFDQSITLAVNYNTSEIASLDAASLTIYTWDGSSWSQLTDCTRNSAAQTVTCTTTHFSLFALFGTLPSDNSQPASSSSSSSSSSTPSSPPACTDAKPGKVPEIIEINTTGTTAKLFFVPAAPPLNYYYIAYGTEDNKWQHGVQFAALPSGGMMPFTINELKSNTVYYFQVRAGNGCMPGDWSNSFAAKTTTGKTVKKFYLHSPLVTTVRKALTQASGVIKKVISPATPSTPSVPAPYTPVYTENPTIIPPPPQQDPTPQPVVNPPTQQIYRPSTPSTPPPAAPTPKPGFFERIKQVIKSIFS